MRYRLQFKNGVWAVFDTHHYQNVAVFFLERKGQEYADTMNRIKR